jgi:hypothetical protein
MTALENSKNGIHSVNGTFLSSFLNAGVETEVLDGNYFIDFANDMSIKVLNGVATAATGTLYAKLGNKRIFEIVLFKRCIVQFGLTIPIK